jgi:hypothetical protein
MIWTLEWIGLNSLVYTLFNSLQYTHSLYLNKASVLGIKIIRNRKQIAMQFTLGRML